MAANGNGVDTPLQFRFECHVYYFFFFVPQCIFKGWRGKKNKTNRNSSWTLHKGIGEQKKIRKTTTNNGGPYAFADRNLTVTPSAFNSLTLNSNTPASSNLRGHGAHAKTTPAVNLMALMGLPGINGFYPGPCAVIITNTGPQCEKKHFFFSKELFDAT